MYSYMKAVRELAKMQYMGHISMDDLFVQWDILFIHLLESEK